MNNLLILGGAVIGFIAGFYLGNKQGGQSMFHAWLFSIYIKRLFTGESPNSCIKHSIKIVEEAIEMHNQNIKQYGDQYRELYTKRIKQLKENRRNNQ